jgi:hypothetical protein
MSLKMLSSLLGVLIEDRRWKLSAEKLVAWFRNLYWGCKRRRIYLLILLKARVDPPQNTKENLIDKGKIQRRAQTGTPYSGLQ